MPLTLTRISPTSLRVIRHFAHPPERVYAAHTDADLLRRWMLGPPGWEITHLVYEAHPGGAIEIVWELDGQTLRMEGAFLELDPPHRTLHRERFHLPDPTNYNQVETLFHADGTGTRLEITMTLPTSEDIDAMLQTPMDEGMEASYARLDTL